MLAELGITVTAAALVATVSNSPRRRKVKATKVRGYEPRRKSDRNLCIITSENISYPAGLSPRGVCTHSQTKG